MELKEGGKDALPFAHEGLGFVGELCWTKKLLDHLESVFKRNQWSLTNTKK